MAKHTMQLANGSTVTIDPDASRVSVTTDNVERIVYGRDGDDTPGDGAGAGGGKRGRTRDAIES